MAEGSDHQHAGTGAGSTQLRTVLLCDLADSTALVERLGDQRGSELIRAHDRVARDLLRLHGGREIDKTDGFLALFERPIQAVAFALAYQRALKELTASSSDPGGSGAGQPAPPLNLRARVGIHVGEVRVWDNAADDVAHGAKPVEVEGLAKPVAARLMGLALPGQVLLSGVAHTLALRAQDELGEHARRTRWLTHGRYRFKGVPQPMVVHEVGEPGVAPLKAPPSGSKVRRELPWYRTPVALGLELAMALAISVGLLWAVLRPDPAIAFAERDWVVVGDLRNLTSEPLFDAALDAAVRIGLEQSRYVNVVPELQVRAALQRMEADPAGPLDRQAAIQLAVREGVRAVILPSISEVGGQVRFSMEVVDPVSGRSVYLKTADGQGRASVLPSVDTVLGEVRASLGESLAQISESAAPLEKVTTSDIEALRSYSLAVEAMQRGDFDQALSLLRYATELDPGFATAHARLGVVHFSIGNMADGRAALARAESLSERLTERERLYVRAQLARFLEPSERVARWRLYADLYPDDTAAQNNLGNYLYMFFNDLAGAEKALSAVIDGRHPLRNLSMHTRGYVRLGQGEFAGALEDFADSLKLAPVPIYYGLADAHAAAGRLEQAASFLTTAPKQTPMLESERVLRRITLLVAQLQYEEAVREASAAQSHFASLPGRGPAWRLAAAAFTARLRAGHTDEAERLAASTVATLAEAVAAGDHPETVEHLLWWAWASARHGLEQPARAALAAARHPEATRGYPVRQQLALAASLELDPPGTASADTRLTQLEGFLDGHELWETRSTLARVVRSTDAKAAAAHVDWLRAHRGLAHAEWLDQLLGQAERVAEWNELGTAAPADEAAAAP